MTIKENRLFFFDNTKIAPGVGILEFFLRADDTMTRHPTVETTVSILVARNRKKPARTKSQKSKRRAAPPLYSLLPQQEMDTISNYKS